ncbi:MAG: glutathione S-transferase N-terminal domain-containing protein [Rhodospirillales bacterium]|nr:glutathione S-transferase N-terminal domain-containing protein [Rhodospirillales bacterium]
MKLRYSPASPYVRKVSVVAIETGLEARIERVPTNVRASNGAFYRDNPLGKVPALVTEGGESLYDSPVICEYLDSLHDGLKLFPPAGGPRWTALRRQALADGIMDAAALIRMETMRPDNEQSPSWIAHQQEKIGRGLDALEDEAATLSGTCTIGHIAIGCALGYVGFRLPHFDWRWGRLELARWFDAFSTRASMAATVPRDP